MNQFRGDRETSEDVLSAYRNRLMYLLGILGVVVLLPLAIHDFLRGDALLALATLPIILILGINAFALYHKKSPPIPKGLLVLSAIISIGISLQTQGVYGAFWSYPAVLFFYFVLSRRAANIYNAALVAVITAIVYYYTGIETTLRFVLTMMLTIISSNVFLSIIDNLQRKLLEQTIIDPLTGALNRRHMESCLEDAVERKRRSGTLASLLLFDVDHFKPINDQFGHVSGDDVLKGLVTLIKQRSRRVDLLFRVGGDEFLLFLPDTTEADAAIVGGHLRKCVAESDLLIAHQVSVSVGVSELRSGESLESWFKQADDALYRAKEGGRNRVVRRSAPVREDSPDQSANLHAG